MKKYVQQKKNKGKTEAEEMKRLYLIGGPMGVGKTTVCRILKQVLPDCMFLDGDWCWDMNPFVVNDETKKMVMDNICSLLTNFLRCSVSRNVVFCWVMHEQRIVDEILNRLLLDKVETVCISLVCSEEELKRRLRKDIDAGVRKEDVIARSLERLSGYWTMNTEKLDVTEMTPEETAMKILETGDGTENCVRAGERKNNPGWN